MRSAHAFALMTIVAFSLLVVPTNAAVIAYAHEVKHPPGYPFTAPESSLGAPWVAYQLSLQTTAGELIGAVDVSITGNALHQRWIDFDFDGLTDPSPVGAASDGRGDSHLTPPAGAPFGFGPTETNSLSGSPLPSTPGVVEYGLGNLAGAWAILTPLTTANLAYIVVNPQASNATFDIRVLAATPTGGPLNNGVAITGVNFIFVPLPPVPEPSSAILFCMGLATCMPFVRRRVAV